MAYSDAFKAETLIRLALNHHDYDKTAEQLHISTRTIKNWEKEYPKNLGIDQLLERAIQRLLMVIPQEMKGRDWAIALGILLDKWLLMQGEPTQRVETLTKTFANLSDEEKAVVVEGAQQIIRELSPGSPGASHGADSVE